MTPATPPPDSSKATANEIMNKYENLKMKNVGYAVALLLVVFVFWITLRLRHEASIGRLAEMGDDITNSIDAHYNEMPTERNEYRRCIEIVKAAYCNAYLSPNDVSEEELRTLRLDVIEKLSIDSDEHTNPQDTLLWLWRRLEQSGPRGRDITTRNEKPFFDCIRKIE